MWELLLYAYNYDQNNNIISAVYSYEFLKTLFYSAEGRNLLLQSKTVQYLPELSPKCTG